MVAAECLAGIIKVQDPTQPLNGLLMNASLINQTYMLVVLTLLHFT
jgi:hypothetical protein